MPEFTSAKNLSYKRFGKLIVKFTQCFDSDFSSASANLPQYKFRRPDVCYPKFSCLAGAMDSAQEAVELGVQLHLLAAWSYQQVLCTEYARIA